MTAADEYQRVLAKHRVSDSGASFAVCFCDWRTGLQQLGFDPDAAHRAHVAQALAADPGVRAAVEREALERAREAIKAERLSIPKQVQVVMGLVRAERIVRDLMPRKDGER